MSRLYLLAIAPLLAAPAFASPASPDWSRARRVQVTLSSFSFSPAHLHLKAGQPVILHLVNASSGGHDFTAPQFFATAAVRPQDRGAIGEEGGVELKGHQSRDVALVPAAGRYRLKCGHTFHSTLGMKGDITVD